MAAQPVIHRAIQCAEDDEVAHTIQGTEMTTKDSCPRCHQTEASGKLGRLPLRLLRRDASSSRP